MKQMQPIQRTLRTCVTTLLCLGTAAVATAAPPSPEPSVTEVMKEAMGLLDKGKFQHAAEGFLRANQLADGQCGPCLLGLSRAYTGLRQHEKAIDAARQAAGMLRSPDLVNQAYNQLGLALMSRPDLPGAEEAFRNAVKAGGQLVNSSRYNLAEVLWRQKQYAESERLAREVLASDPNGPAAKSSRIVLCQAKVDAAPPLTEALYEKAACNAEALRLAGKKKEDLLPADSKVVSPEKIFGDPPSYDYKSSLDGVDGVVIVESVIDEDGCVQRMRLCKSVHPRLDRAALDAARHWVFLPATLENQPVKVYYTLTVNFTIGSRPGPG